MELPARVGLMAGLVLVGTVSCTDPESAGVPEGLYALQSMNGEALPVPGYSDSLVSGRMALRSDSIFGIYLDYRGPTSGQRLTAILGRWSLSGNALTYRAPSGEVIASGTLSTGGATFVQASDASSFAFARGEVDDPAILTDRGSYSITVSGTLTGTTKVSDTSHFATGMGDHILMNPQGYLLGGKQFSSLGPADGRDFLLIQVNPKLTAPGTYGNNSCPFQNGFGTKCVALSYQVSQPPGTFNNRGSLWALPDDRITVVIEALSFWHTKMSLSGPFEWWPPMPPGVAQQKDTVTVNASFNAFRVR